MPRCDCRSRCPCRHPAPQEREALEDDHRWSCGAKRGPARGEIPRQRALATVERIPPPKPRRVKDALYGVAWPAAHGAGLRSPRRGTPGPHRRSERLHRARHTRDRIGAISRSGERGSSAFSRFVQQSPPERIRLAYMLAVYTGQRQGDLLRLTWNNYDGHRIRLKQSKGGQKVSIPVAAPLKAALD